MGLNLGDVVSTLGSDDTKGIITDVGRIATEVRSVVDTVFAPRESPDAPAPTKPAADSSGQQAKPVTAAQSSGSDTDSFNIALVAGAIVVGVLLFKVL